MVITCVFREVGNFALLISLYNDDVLVSARSSLIR